MYSSPLFKCFRHKYFRLVPLALPGHNPMFMSATHQHTTQSRPQKVRKNKNRRHVMLHLAFLTLTGILLTLTLHALISKHSQTCTNSLQRTTTSQTSTYIFHTLTALRRSTPHHNRPNNIHSRRTILLLLLLCGDTGAIVNPGPYRPKYPCMICARAVKWRQRAIQ